MLRAWKTEQFEMNPDFEMPDPRTPSAKHQERGRCWEHICQPVPILSGTPPRSLCPPPGRRLYSLGLQFLVPTGGQPGASLEVAAAECGLLSLENNSVAALRLSVAPPPQPSDEAFFSSRKWGADPSSDLLSLQSSQVLCWMANSLLRPFAILQHTS